MKNNLKNVSCTGLLIFALVAMQACVKTDPGTANNSNNNSVGGNGSNTGNNTVTATVTLPSTQFISSADYTVNNLGAYWTQSFTITQSTTFIFRFASQYQAQAAIIPADQLSKFQANQSFTGYSLFDKTFGTNKITLSAGVYAVAVRNAVSAANKWSVELDYATTLPASDKATFIDDYVSGVKAFSGAGKFWQPFTIQTGYRYFLDGCNVNCDFKIIPATEFSAFQAGQSYKYYTQYADASGAAPGLWEISLPAGDYYLVSSNTSVAALTYLMERWKVN